MKSSIPKYVTECIAILNEHGYEGWLVGGCVRDMLLDRTPNDYDIATNALPADVMSVFDKTFPSGLKYGTVTVLIDHNPIEVTTYRIDGDYKDSRRPQEVLYVSELKSDLSRRDFTINAMAFHPQKDIFDPFGGALDLKNKIIKTVGCPDTRFGEDALRIFRCFRFASQLSFCIEEDTENSALKLSHTLKNISVERIRTELVKSLISPNPQMIEPLINTGALSFLGLKNGPLDILKELPSDEITRLSGFLFLTGSYDAALDNLCLSNKTKQSVQKLIDMLNAQLPDKIRLKKEINGAGIDNIVRYCKLCKILKGINTDNLLADAVNIADKKIPINVHMLKINGNDLIKTGITDGILIGQIFDYLLHLVLDNEGLNEKRILLKKARAFAEEKSMKP